MKLTISFLFSILCLCVSAQTAFYPGNPPTIFKTTGVTVFNVPTNSGGGGYPVITNGLVLAFPFSPSSFNDTSGNGNNGTATGSPTFTTGVGNGANVAVSLDGSSQYINIGHGSALDVSAITVVAWVKFTSLANAYSAVVSKIDFSIGDFNQIFIKSNGKLAIYLGLGGGLVVDNDGQGSHNLGTGTWYQIAYTYDSTSGLVGYVNGALDGTAGANGALPSFPTKDTYIGNDSFTSGRIPNASVEGVLIYNRALSSGEISTLYSNSAP